MGIFQKQEVSEIIRKKNFLLIKSHAEKFFRKEPTSM